MQLDNLSDDVVQHEEITDADIVWDDDDEAMGAAGDLARAGRHDRLARDRAISIPTVASAARIPMTVRRREAALRAAQVADARPQFAVANTSTRTLQRFFGTRHGLLHFYGRRARRQG